jgi:hypothetical protein
MLLFYLLQVEAADKANLDVGVSNFLLYVAGVIILILLGIVGYLIRCTISAQKTEIKEIKMRQEEHADKLSTAVVSLSEAVSNLRSVVEVLNAKTEADRKRYDKVDMLLEKHDERLDSHDKEIVKLRVMSEK